MRFVVKNESDKPKKLSSEKTYNDLKDIAINKSKSKISDSIYRDPYDTRDGKRSKVEDQLAISYKNKCAYCEAIAKADIDHYRPKNKVQDTSNHEGYYWLCYEWTNLLPACVQCNRDGGKHAKFPVIGRRVLSPSILHNGELDLESFKASNKPLIDEEPYLLHPEIDLPEDYFGFEIDNEFKGIRICGIDERGRGEQTINICKLNRHNLLLQRVEIVIDDFRRSVKGVFDKYANGRYNEDQLILIIENLIEGLIHKSNDDVLSFTLLRKYIVRNSANFEKIVLPFFENTSIRKILLAVFRSLK